MYTIVFDAGKVWLQHKTTLCSEPQYIISRWLLSEERYVNPDLNGKPARWNGYVLTVQTTAPTPLRIELIDRKADVTFCTPIPAPKVRQGTKTRYQDGCWQKLTKQKGWIAV